MSQVWEQMEATLPARAPWLWESFNPPASKDDLLSLQRAFDPIPVPPALLAYLARADGQRLEGIPPWLPSLDLGRLLSAREIIAEYQDLFTYVEDWQWSRRWLPISREGWWSAAVEMVDTRPAMVLNVSWPDAPSLRAPSLPALFAATLALVEDGLVPHPSSDEALVLNDPETYKVHLKRVETILQESYRAMWGTPPFPPGAAIDSAQWIQAWGGPTPPPWRV
ncbi:hypothetical protein DDQ50_16400 [Amnibacterium flavum]|uniref:Knr4/Smi1-like domain-containing protein n=2 Tax=Amnibacterium flavum TaxID=2173173 RepID=A0A2V1HQ79_9MICO|nr:hypothetical protein DDQ50_16400 [Amnibacterium flavum]